MNYKELYISLIKEKCPEKLQDMIVLSKLDRLDSSLSIIELNDLLFHDGKRIKNLVDSRLRSYTEAEIIRILKYQKRYNVSNMDIVKKYGMSRTTLNTWQKRFYNI